MLAQTTARNVIGNMKFAEVNSQQAMLNRLLAETIDKEIINWGLRVVRVELKDITPPKSVQETMNNIIKAQNAKMELVMALPISFQSLLHMPCIPLSG